MKLKTKKNYFQQDIKKNEYARGIGQACLLVFVFSYLYYESAWSIIPLIPLGFWYFKDWEAFYIEKKKREFQVQFKDAIQAIGAALSVGYSPENAMKEAQRDLQVLYDQTSRIQKEFTYMVHELQVNITLEQVLEEWAKRVEQEDVQTFASIFSTAKKSGGNMIGIIRNAIRQMSGKIEVEREIETMLTAKKYEFRVMSAVPFMIIFYMKISFPEFMRQLYGNILGVGVMTICLGIYAAAFFMGKKITNIEI